MRAVYNDIRYVCRTVCAWEYLPKDFLHCKNRLLGLKRFSATLRAEGKSSQGKEVDALKMAEILINTGFTPVRAKSLFLFGFQAIFDSVFV